MVDLHMTPLPVYRKECPSFSYQPKKFKKHNYAYCSNKKVFINTCRECCMY